ncbi:MAG: SDR family NAD-dependent epimerase/dehydratase, partial [Trueperaceae bacterium]|nr:SDR family NAD-dependent epimerase/dehydratase [Trueperaceae bacterium]
VTGPINLGNPGEFTMLELAQKVLAITGSSSAIVHHALPVDDPRQRQPLIERARSLLDWAPTVDLAIGLERTVAYFEGLLLAGVVASEPTRIPS